MADHPLRLGVDTGGTFTDVVARDPDGTLRVTKRLSTPDAPWAAIVAGARELGGEALGEAAVVHGTTVATNALLERRGARAVLITTAGFEDVLRLRRQHRPELYALQVVLPEPLLGPQDCLGARERVGADGGVIVPLSEETIEDLVAQVAARDDEAVAIMFLHAYANPAHEARVASALREALPHVHVTASHELSRELREYERASTVSVNAYVGPVMSRYLRALDAELGAASLEVFASSGARLSVEQAAAHPALTALSGPAGGALGAQAAAREAGFEAIIAFDMGGTSTDVSLSLGAPTLAYEGALGALPLQLPMLDIHTVGAGGGSIAWIDAGGALRVGPHSAGAAPGPAAYGQGGESPTVTDAHVVLGRLDPERFLGGQMRLDVEAARAAVGRIAQPLGLSREEAAEAILAIADAAMVRAIKVISLERGHDPRELGLVAFGGAGGLHACRLARELELPAVIIPRHPGLLSAWGMLHAPRARHLAQTMLVPLPRDGDDDALRQAMRTQADAARASLGEGVTLRFGAALRYHGQTFTLALETSWAPDAPTLEDLSARFHQAHHELYGWSDEARPITLVTLRLTARVAVDGEVAEVVAGGAPAASAAGASSPSRAARGGAYERAELAEGEVVEGPCLITEYSATTVVEAGWRATCRAGHLVLTPCRADDFEEVPS